MTYKKNPKHSGPIWRANDRNLQVLLLWKIKIWFHSLWEQFYGGDLEWHKKTKMPTKGPSQHPNMEKIDVQTKGVHKLLSDLKTHKVTGLDSIPAFILKTAAADHNWHQFWIDCTNILLILGSTPGLEECLHSPHFQEGWEAHTIELPPSLPCVKSL